MDPSAINLLQTVIGGGPALIFAIMWYLERSERVKLQSELIKTLTNMSQINELWLKVLPKDGSSR